MTLVLDVKDELGPLDVPLLECLELVAVVGNIARVDDAKLRDQSADERLDEQFLLCDQQGAACDMTNVLLISSMAGAMA